jgi:putative transcriptional regulator
MKTLRVRVKKFRNKKGLTQEELAERVGVRRETIVFLERGKYNPSLKLALNISQELNVPIGKLFFLS